MKHTLTFFAPVCGALLLLTGCKVQEVKVGVENAKFQHGYLNSKLLGQGTLLLWDMDAAADRQLTLLPSPKTEDNDLVDHAGGAKLSSVASSGVSVHGALPLEQVSASAKAEIARQTAVVVEDFQSKRFYDSDFVLNEPDFADRRQTLGEAYAHNDRIRFIFIAGATVADDAAVAVGTPTQRPDEFELSIGGKKYRLSYYGTKSVEWEGSQEPVFIQPRVYKIVEDQTGATGYRFLEDRRIQFDLTQMLTNASL
ncbi:MAG: hypothetical protein DVB23_000199 [Verrucomicrobia bacterium]|jgi:hypothetical protein|nr:MAG: hypothetical protein DVB23_000199 [Verrucomicrobiota bacterium]